MLYRKIGEKIRSHLTSGSDKILIVEGARQIGKSFIIRHVGSQLFKNVIEINFAEDKEGAELYRDIRTTEDFYLQLSTTAGEKMGKKEDTLIFLDEIQEYPQFLTLLKFFRQEARFTFIASGSLLGVTLRQTTSIPIGSIAIMDMYPLDFEEFLIANGYNQEALDYIKKQYRALQPLSEAMHKRTLDLFLRYLIVGGMPDAVNMYLSEKNITKVRNIQSDIINLYKIDASKYDTDRRLNIRRIYDMVPSAMENKKKRITIKDIEDKQGARFEQYAEDFEYVISSGIALDVRAISNPKFPLLESSAKNLIKLYMNDVGLLTSLLYGTNIKAILDNVESVNLGSVYETAVAQELKCRSKQLFYYDNKKYGEVDFLIDDYSTLSVLPIEVKSGKDYTRHTSLSRFVATPDYGIKKAYVLSNAREIKMKDGIAHLPIYYAMAINESSKEDIII